jgi:hypothetical protein
MVNPHDSKLQIIRALSGDGDKESRKIGSRSMIGSPKK